MPTIQYPKSPNVDTAFVVQEDGTKNRALMVAPQDISTLELPDNPNSTKGYVTVDGQKQRVLLTATLIGGGASLPDQTGQSGKFLTTDGTDASWGAVSASSIGATTSSAISVTLAAANWSSSTQTVTATGVTASNTVVVSPASASASDYASAEILCTAQASDSLTFTCVTTPSNDITVNVLIVNS